MSVGAVSNKLWNVTATLAVLLVLAYVGASAAAMLLGKIDYVVFKDGVLPVVMAALVFMGRFLPSERES